MSGSRQRWSAYRAPLFFVCVLIFSTVMVIRQYRDNGLRHVRIREDFILLQQRGYVKKAEWYYQRLIRRLDRLSDRILLEDYQRTALLVDPDVKQLDNLVWKYHWVVRNKLERRVQKRLERILEAEAEIRVEP